MELQGIVFSEISQVEKEKYQMTSLICGVLTESKCEGTKQQRIHRLQEATSGYQRGGVWQGAGNSREI